MTRWRLVGHLLLVDYPLLHFSIHFPSSSTLVAFQSGNGSAEAPLARLVSEIVCDASFMDFCSTDPAAYPCTQGLVNAENIHFSTQS